MAFSAICVFKLFLLSLKRVNKTVGLLRNFQNVFREALTVFEALNFIMVILYMANHTTSPFMRN